MDNVEKSTFEMGLYLITIGYHPEDVMAYSDEEIKESYVLETT